MTWRDYGEYAYEWARDSEGVVQLWLVAMRQRVLSAPALEWVYGYCGPTSGQ